MPYKSGNSFIDINRKLRIWEQRITTTMLYRGLYAGASVGAAYASVMTPVLTSNLINSQYITVRGEQFGARAIVGYTANYAAAVHEKPGTLKGTPRPKGEGNYWDPNGEPQFLKSGFEDNAVEINNVIIRTMKI